MIHLRSISKREIPEAMGREFPFRLEVMRGLETLEFGAPVTFFVGENGSGKSTLLESIACAVGAITVGSESVRTDPSLEQIRKFSQYLRLVWNKRTHRGFYLRAEDFFGYARKLAQIRAELEKDLQDVDREYEGRSQTAKDYGSMPYKSELYGIQSRYGDGLDSASHGESFLALFQSRFVPGGLYLLDEPEAPLSPLRQLGLIAMLKEMVGQEAQFVIATHSPILMAFPGAEIWNFDGGRLRKVGYGELENVRLMREFLENPEAYLRQLWKDEE